MDWTLNGIEAILLAETVASLVAWAVATWRFRHHLLREIGPFATLMIGMLIWVSLLGQLTRSLLPHEAGDVGGLVLAVVRGLFLIVGIALAWTGPPRSAKR